MENRLPAIEVAPGDPRLAAPMQLFPEPCRDLWLEIGFGGGEHLAWQARNNPEVGIIGVEIFVNGVASLLRAIESDGLGRVRICRSDALDLLPWLPDGCLGRIFLLFPDPWPKARHHKRRIVRPDVLREWARLLRPGGELRIATDHPSYLTWVLAEMARSSAFVWTARHSRDWTRRPADWPPTRYEEKAMAEGRPATYLTYRRR